MGVSSPLKGPTNLPTMKFLVVLFASSVLALPRPAEEALVAEAEVEQDIAAVPYVHEEIEALPYEHEEIEAVVDKVEDIPAEAYAHEDIDALPYVHEEPAYNHEEIAAEEYVHVEGASAPVAAPVVYTGLPYVHSYAGYPYTALSYAGLATPTPTASQLTPISFTTPAVLTVLALLCHVPCNATNMSHCHIFVSYDPRHIIRSCNQTLTPWTKLLKTRRDYLKTFD